MKNIAEEVNLDVRESNLKSNLRVPRASILDVDFEILRYVPTEELLFINKPYDVCMDGSDAVTVEKLVKHHMPEVESTRWVHQLDLATSGILCIALSKQSASVGCELFRNRKVDKTYLAVVKGHISISDYQQVSIEGFDSDDYIAKSKESFNDDCRTKSRKSVIYKTACAFFDDMKKALKKRPIESLSLEETEILGKKWKEVKRDEKLSVKFFEDSAKDKARVENSKRDSEAEVAKSKKSVVFRIGGDIPGRFVIDHPIAEVKDSFRMEVGSAQNPGKEARTVVDVLETGYYQGNPVTKVKLHLITGRRHQLRVHLLSLGHPIVGDFTYAKDTVSPRMMLHAHSLR